MRYLRAQLFNEIIINWPVCKRHVRTFRECGRVGSFPSIEKINERSCMDAERSDQGICYHPIGYVTFKTLARLYEHPHLVQNVVLKQVSQVLCHSLADYHRYST